MERLHAQVTLDEQVVDLLKCREHLATPLRLEVLAIEDALPGPGEATRRQEVEDLATLLRQRAPQLSIIRRDFFVRAAGQTLDRRHGHRQATLLDRLERIP